MHAAAQALIGEHDFSAFRSVECQSKTTVRRVERIEVRREGDYLWLEIAANAYLHHMVRNIVGTLHRRCNAKRTRQQPWPRCLASGNRRFAGATAPAAGLYLWQVEYPPVYGIPAPAPGLLLPARWLIGLN